MKLSRQEIYEQLEKIKADGYKIHCVEMKFIEGVCPREANIFGKERPLEQKIEFSGDSGCSCEICIPENSILPYIEFIKRSWQKNCESKIYYINDAVKDSIINYLRHYLMPNGS